MFKKVNFILLLLLSMFLFVNQGNSQSKYLVQLGNIESIKSTVLNEDRAYYVQLPQNYNGKKKYPVIYVLDGDVLLNAVHLVHDNYYGGFMPEMIIVGVSNANNRTRDLTTSKITERHGMPYNEENGEANNWSGLVLSHDSVPKRSSYLKYVVRLPASCLIQTSWFHHRRCKCD